ncbi:MAG TPA: emopamil-binding family protein [Candidatus Binatia bacterium]|nr:emopamil-binding family protein [Candidatus Binatia bacterium]
MPPDAPPLSAIDRLLVACFGLFAFTSICMEPYITFGIDLTRATDPLGRAWYFYARSWDPLFLAPPVYLRVMTGIDEWIFGPMWLALIHAFLRRRAGIRRPALLFCGAIIYSTLVYFLVEFVSEGHRANLVMVTAVNAPYTLVPCVLAWRMWRPAPFASHAAAA